MKLLIYTSLTQAEQSAAALASACHAARHGTRVLLASCGPTHLLGSLLGQSLSGRPLELEPNLAAMEISAIDEVGQRWDHVRPTFRGGITARLRELGADELPMFPGIDAVAALLVAERARAVGRFDLLILDGPGPDTLLRTLALPDTIRWMLRLVFGIDRGPGRSRSSLERAMVPATLIAPNAVSPLQDLRVVLEEQRAALSATSGTRVRLVTDPLSLRQAPLRSLLGSLGFYGMAVDELVVAAASSQVEPELRAEFRPDSGRPALRIGELPLEPADRDTWAQRGAALYHNDSVAAAATPPSATGEREIRLHIPFLDARTLDVAIANEEVVVRIGALRRHLTLPGVNEGGRLRARVEGETLRLWVE